MTPLPSHNLDFANVPIQSLLALQPHIDHAGQIIYHNSSKDARTGIITERIYDQYQRLVRVVKSLPGNRCETHYDGQSGQIKRTNEVSTMPDGNLICRDIVYSIPDRSSEIVTIISQAGHLLKIIERENIGSRCVFLGQTDYNTDGCPAVTINQHMSRETGELTHREQIQWLAEGQRAMTEHFYFAQSGLVSHYVKILHYATGGIFSEETQDFDSAIQKLSRRQLAAFSVEGHQTCLDVLYYSHDGQIKERQSTFFNFEGRPIACHSFTNSS